MALVTRRIRAAHFPSAAALSWLLALPLFAQASRVPLVHGGDERSVCIHQLHRSRPLPVPRRLLQRRHMVGGDVVVDARQRNAHRRVESAIDLAIQPKRYNARHKHACREHDDNDPARTQGHGPSDLNQPVSSGSPRGRAQTRARGAGGASCVGTATPGLRNRVPPYSARRSRTTATDSGDSRPTPRTPATRVCARPRSI